MASLETLRSHANALFARDGGLHPPIEIIKHWPRPNHVDPEERGWEAPIVLFVMLGITFMVYVARMWARLAVAKNAGLDDLLISLSMLPLIGLTVTVVLAIRQYGFQWHVWDQTATTLVTTREITMAIELNYMVSTTLIKVSILCFYRRITGSLTNNFVYWVLGTMVFCIIYGILFSFLILFTCSPVVGYFRLFDSAWRYKNEVHCMNEGVIIVVCAALSSVQDFLICMLPIFLIWNLQISHRQKAALCGIFGMGLVTCVCGIMRTYYATYVYNYTYDITWYAYYGWVWTALEAQLGVVCASAPAIKVFFKRYFSNPASRNGYPGSASNKTPLGSAPRSQSYQMQTPQASHMSKSRSQVVSGRPRDPTVPLECIKVSHGLDIAVDERDDASQKSYASTRNLTALPTQDPFGRKAGWYEGCRTVCSALNPRSRSRSRSRSESRSRSREKDIERGLN
ncbi:hypothetical protein ACN47E_004070 [Coniothyrium glycines]